jgi:2,4-dienoyl-CoA reductase-like NADH-dependent reductase (Old Yellow Enzyme family)
MSALFTPLKMRGLTLSNRIVVSPMCQYSADQGQATAWHMVHLNTLALSGAGMLCIEATSVEAEGRITPGDLGLYDDATEAALRPVLNAIRRNTGTAVVVQLAHAGRKASCAVPWEGGEQMPPGEGGWLTHAPSAIAHKSGESTPQVLDAAGLDRIRSAFAASARRAAQLGLDGIEIHAAHGYLLHEFLSPLSNQRTDEYGGSLANRMRFPLEVFDAARAAFPATQPVGLRLSATDWTDGGWDLEQSIAFAAELAQRGVDWVDASSGGISPQQKIPTAPGYQVAFAAAIKQATGVNTVAVGLITQTQQAEDIVAGGKADLVALARGMPAPAGVVEHAAAALGASVSAPPQYWRAAPHGHQGLFKLTS